jgi:uncharacterized protein (DUF1697 family)
METYIAILRGINVSGYKTIKMEDLRELFNDMKFKNVQTYIQSGNVIFESKKTEQSVLQKKIEKKILEIFGYEVPVLVKEKSEVEFVLKNNYFINKKKDVVKLYVTFLAEEPEQSRVNKIIELNYKPDEFVISGKEIYLFCPNGYGNSKLSNIFFESKLKVSATTRNWKTVNELLSIANSISKK